MSGEMPDVGDLLGGKHQLARRLGQGGMGTVYEAVHKQIGKSVVVKVLLPESVTGLATVAAALLGWRTRFRRAPSEAEIVTSSETASGESMAAEGGTP